MWDNEAMPLTERWTNPAMLRWARATDQLVDCLYLPAPRRGGPAQQAGGLTRDEIKRVKASAK